MNRLPDIHPAAAEPYPQLPYQGGGMVPYDGYSMAEPDDDGLDLREIWRIVRKYRRTILLFTLIVLVTTAAATLMMRPIYQATAIIEIDPENRGVVKFQNVDSVDLNPWTYQQTQARIIQSDAVAQAVVERLDLENNLVFNATDEQRGLLSGLGQIKTALIQPLLSGIKAVLIGPPQAERADTAAYSGIDRALAPAQPGLSGSVRGGLSVVPVRDSNLFEVSYESVDPVLAAAISNAVVEEYVNLSNEKRFQSTAGAKAYLEREISQIQARLETSEKELNEFSRKNQVVDLEDRNNIFSTRLQELSQSLTQVKGDRINAESLYLQARESDIDTLPAVLENELIRNLRQAYSGLSSEYARLSRIYKPKYPKLRELRGQLDDIGQSLNQEIANIVASLEVRYQQLRSREGLLEQVVEQQKQQLLELQDRAIQYNILKRESETNRELYSGLLERMKEVGVAAGMELDNIAVIDKAVVPEFPYKPSLRRNMLIALVLGLMGGTGLAFLLAFLDNTVRTPEEMERLVHLPNLGLLPKMGDKEKDGVKLELIAHLERDKSLSEAMRSLRTSLIFSSPNGAPQTLMVTSSAPSEGKTTIAVNLSIVLAQNGASVLLVDSDLRMSRVHKLFDVPRAPGLTDYLVNGESLSFHDTGIDNLSLLTAGTTSPNPAELLSSQGMAHLLESISDRFDHIVFDAAPIMGLADSVVLSTKVKGVLLVAGAGQVSKGALRESVKRLRTVRSPLLGVVLNQVMPDSSEYGYYAHYYYNYGDKEQLTKQAS